MANKKKSLSEEVSKEIKSKFDLNGFKDKKGLSGNVKYKLQQWIPFSEPLQEILEIPGVAMGHINLLRGHSNTGKTTALIEVAMAAQKMGILPVLIITEMKHSWEHWKSMGFEYEEVVDKKTGEIIDFEGNFLYKDRETLNSIESVAEFIADLMDEQKKGNLPYDLLFLWDSIGSIPCQMSLDQNKNNPMWNAGAMSQQFANFINQKIVLSRKESFKYTNTMVAVNKTWVAPALTPMAQPKLKNKNGDAMFYDASLVFTFGGIINAGTSKIKAQNNKKEFEFGLRTRVNCDKNHVTGVTAKGQIISTAHGFIKNTPTEIKKYKDKYKDEWSNLLGEGNYDIIEEEIDVIDGLDETE